SMEPKIKEDADNAMLDSLLADPFENNSP
nr:Chain C, Protein panoramix [Drosophila melanogaster]7MKK_D Chain D, Protein panoramix [Drosophila melanogaster]7MKK_F Chain F, Protein panoramix [Drosophila melanogaster]7MKK_H Chain H, Protein panoramix [Drosophila melanogaster]